MARTDRSTLVGVFEDRTQAERAIDELHRAGFTDEQIGFAERDQDGSSDVHVDDRGSNAGQGAVGGALAGAGIGGLIAAAASLLVPGFGPVLAGGILATTIGGAAVGAAAGGILGGLIGAGVPEEEARYYEGEFNTGRVLVTVRPGDRYDEAREILYRHGGYDMERSRSMTTGTTAVGTTPRMGGASTTSDVHTEDTDRLRLHEEELHATTRPVEAGEVRVTKDVVEEQQSIEVPITREEVYIERRPVDRPATDPNFNEDEIRVPVMHEEVDVDKTARVREEVEIGKRPVQETQTVSGTVRREEAHVDRTGDINVHGWDDVSTGFRQRWQSRYGTSGGRWEDYEPGYRYGYEMASDPRYQGREWANVESDLRRDWGTWGQRYGYRYTDSDWDRYRDEVHEAWDAGRGFRRAA